MDVKALSEQIGLEEDEYLEMLDMFVESAGEDLQRLEAALAAGDAPAAHAAAHSLKGASGSLCLEELFEQARAIDDKARAGDLAGVDSLCKNLRARYRELAADIQARTG